MSNPNDFQNMNKYQVYRKIRSDRAFRTLGKMNLYRVIAGILLLVLVLLISGAVSQSFASRRKFKEARFLMISPGWVEKYKPELKAFIDAGVLYQDGDYTGAHDAFDAIDGLDAALSMREVCTLWLAQSALDAGDSDSAYDHVSVIDSSLLPEDELPVYHDICNKLLERFMSSSNSDDLERAEFLRNAAATAS